MNYEKAIEIISDMVPKKRKLIDGCLQGGYSDWESEKGRAAHFANVAMRKQIPENVPDIEHFGRCPDCDSEFNSELLNKYNIEFCPWCGQALKWD